MTEPTTTPTSTDSTATDQPATTAEPTLESVAEQLATLTERVAELEAEVERKDERIEELEAQRDNDLIEINADGDTAGLTDIWVAGIPLGSILQNTTEDVDRAHSRLDDVEAVASENSTPGGEMNTAESHETTTPLERICALPEHVADRELTTNQERARFIARDVRDYAEKAPAGLVLDSQTIAKVITAAEGTKPHTQTVARVMDFLANLGKDEVEQTKRRGKKLVVVDEEAADRYHDRCDRANEQAPAGGVMS
jgi:vacuolar-type H+-ATPase subunit I/STV1